LPWEEGNMVQRRLVCVALAAGLVGGLGAIASGQALLQPGMPAPDIGGGPWINSEPLSLAGLRGRVILIDFWTYG
jgi:hypothetical protein